MEVPVTLVWKCKPIICALARDVPLTYMVHASSGLVEVVALAGFKKTESRDMYNLIHPPRSLGSGQSLQKLLDFTYAVLSASSGNTGSSSSLPLSTHANILNCWNLYF